MRDRVKRKADKAAANQPQESGQAAAHHPLLALQRSAGNAATLAMLNRGEPARPSASTPDQLLRSLAQPVDTIRRVVDLPGGRQVPLMEGAVNQHNDEQAQGGEQFRGNGPELTRAKEQLAVNGIADTKDLRTELGIDDLADLVKRYPGGKPPSWLAWVATGQHAGGGPFPKEYAQSLEGLSIYMDRTPDGDPKQAWLRMDEDERLWFYWTCGMQEAPKLAKKSAQPAAAATLTAEEVDTL